MILHEDNARRALSGEPVSPKHRRVLEQDFDTNLSLKP